MVTIIKNQLLKHLSRYTKNLSPEQISLSAFKGSGELQDITLDEDVLTDLLELPGWLRLTSAKCNRASFRIQWTKLKSVPIVLNLDEVHIALEVCSEPRTMNPDAASAMPAPGKYSYIHKAIDGISVMVNQVQIDFSCDAFSSSVQITRVTVESRTPDGRKGDLRSTRIKSPDTGQLLLFKEVEWQSVRIEAKPKGSAAANLPPLRLLLGNTLCRIVIKKRLSDCSVLGSRLVLQPEAVAWALTDGQLRAALSCAQALAQPVKKATQQATRTKALKKVEQPLEQIHSRSAQNENDLYARLFEKYDVKETSYHLLASRIDLHLCDDPGLGRSEKPLLSNGGALQVTLLGMQADFFPYHRASSDRRHWRGYRESATPHTQWLSQALSQFCSSLLESLDPRPMTPTPNANQERREPMSNGVPHFTTDTNNSASSNPSNQNTTSQGSPTRTKVLQQLGKLMSTCLILRIDNFTVYKVSKGLKSREPPRPLVSAEKATMPGDAGLLHAELTHFYYPGDVCFPVPPPKFYSQMSPVRISVDPDSLVWLAAFFRHVAQSLVDVAPANGPFYMDVRCEAIMPKIVFEAGSEHVPQQRDRPREMQICTARANFTNVREHARTDAPGTRADLASTLSLLRRSAPSSGQFPTSEDDVSPLHEAFMLHADCLDDIERGPELDSCWLWRENRSVWCFRAEPLWVELCHARATPKPTTLLDAIPITAWIYLTEDFSRIWVAAKTCGLACLQLNHYQLLFLLRTMEKISDMMAWLAHDAARDPLSKDSSIVVGIYAPAAEMSIVLPSTCPGQESSRDLDSVPLDSSSLQDMRMGSDITMAPSNIDRDSGVVANSTVHFTNISSNEYMHPMQPIPIPITTTAVESLPSNSVAYFSGVSSMFRGFNSLVSSIDMSLSRDDTRSDAASTASSDSERYVVLGLTADSPHDADVAFREFEHGRCSSGVEMGVEVAADIIERSSSPSDHSITSCCRRRDLISTCSFHLNNIHMVHQSVKEKTTLRLVADDLKSEECSSMPWDEFQDKFSMRARAFVEPTFDGDEFKPRVSPKVAARLNRTVLETPPRIKDEPATLAECDQLLEAQLRDLSIALNMSTALSLAEFIEDEVVIQPMPLEILLENLKLHIKEDRQARSISSPPPQPIDITLNDIRLTRDTSGVLHLGPHKSVAKTSDENIAENVARTNIELELLSRENEELKKRLNTLSRIAEDNRELRAKVEEASLLRQCVHAAQQETESLLADKLQLLTTIRCLQDQLNSRGKR